MAACGLEQAIDGAILNDEDLLLSSSRMQWSGRLQLISKKHDKTVVKLSNLVQKHRAEASR